MTEIVNTPHGAQFKGRTYSIIDGLSMPTPERKWFEQWQEAGLTAVNTTIAVWENSQETLGLLAKWRRIIDENRDLVATATSVQDIEAIRQSGRTAILLGFQNTAPVDHNLDLFGSYRDLGVVIMQLTYNLQNYIGCGYWEEKDSGISSRFGRKAIEEMNKVGILIDLSHCGERTTLEAIETSAKPVAITHANPREFVGTGVYGSGRQKTTEAIRALGKRHGVIGLSPNRNMTTRGAATTLQEFGDMVAWTVDLVGIDAVAIGSDYCPGHTGAVRSWWRYARWSREKAPAEQMTMAPHEGWSEWVSKPSGLSNIIVELDRRGFAADEIDKIMSGNWLRLFTETFAPDSPKQA